MTEEFKNLKDKWEDLGKEKPYWSVLANERYSKENLTEENKNRFYDSGKGEISRLYDFCEKAGVQFPKGSCLEYGCGLGRVSFQLAEIFQNVVGVDISQKHIEIAKEQKKEVKLQKCRIQSLRKRSRRPVKSKSS